MKKFAPNFWRACPFYFCIFYSFSADDQPTRPRDPRIHQRILALACWQRLLRREVAPRTSGSCRVLAPRTHRPPLALPLRTSRIHSRCAMDQGGVGQHGPIQANGEGGGLLPPAAQPLPHSAHISFALPLSSRSQLSPPRAPAQYSLLHFVPGALRNGPRGAGRRGARLLAGREPLQPRALRHQRLRQ